MDTYSCMTYPSGKDDYFRNTCLMVWNGKDMNLMSLQEQGNLMVVAVRLEIAQGGCWAIKAFVGCHGQRIEHYPTAISLVSSQALLSRPLPGADMLLSCPIVTASTGGWCARVCLSRLGDCNLRTLCLCLLWVPTTWPGIQPNLSVCATYDAYDHRVAKRDISESFQLAPDYGCHHEFSVTSFVK